MFKYKNMSSADRILRVSLALGVGILYGLGRINGLLAAVLGLAAAAFLATGFIGICPLYLPFHASTRKTKPTQEGRKQ
ncbi:MAG: DUF2892 domain-containing protein [Ktedonobacteraceae bacterium]|nr:DUF2892 domain-containing protein [Ktedonobacteraceae bacterium]